MRFTTWLLENYSDYQDTCEVCGLPDEDKVYMVNDEIYKKAGIRRMAHIECLERKLGRRLNSNDFTQYAHAPCNIYNKKVQERIKG